MFSRDMVCLRNVSVDIVRKGDAEDESDVDGEDNGSSSNNKKNNKNNNNNNQHRN
jgi:hypothetical protein